MKLSVVSTLYQSRIFLDEFLVEIEKAIQLIQIDDYELIFVNDGSPDNSLQHLITLKKEKYPKIKIIDSRSLNLTGDKQEKLVQACKQLKADIYLSGPAAKSYIDEDFFASNQIKVKWMDYSNYKTYNQLYPPFEHRVSILDLIFNEGANAKKYLKSYI